MAVGFAADDAAGNRDFEIAVTAEAGSSFDVRLNPKAGIFGRVKKTGLESKLMKKKGAGLAEEEQREILRAMFEGQGSQSGKIITQELEGNSAKANKGAAAYAGGFDHGYFDRLSSANLHGYSPQLQALQSALNQRRAPGAPKLIETGKLDYETLSYPAYAMKYDISNLERRLRWERTYALAKALGRERQFSAEQLLDAAVEAQLKSEAAAKGVALTSHFERRQAALERAAAALRDFDTAAKPGKDPLKISRSMLVSLGSHQSQAARWITVASLEGELERLGLQRGFLSPELLSAIERAPAAASIRAAYKRRGDDYDRKLKTIIANDETAVSALESLAWLSQMHAVETALAANATLGKDLPRNIADFVATPFRLNAFNSAKPRWRKLVDQAIKRFLPRLAYSRALVAIDKHRARLEDVFVKIASGDLDAAHTVLSAE